MRNDPRKYLGRFARSNVLAAGHNPGKVEKVMHEWGKGALRSGSKRGPVVKSQKQALAIGFAEARKAGEKVPAKKGK